MSTREQIELGQIDNITAGQNVVINCPVGDLTYDQIKVFHDSITAAQLTDIKVILGGTTIWEFADGTALNAYNDYYGRSTPANYLDFWFLRPEMLTAAAQRMFALGCVNVSSLVIKMKIDAAAVVGDFLAWGVISDGKPLDQMTIIKTFDKSFAAGGDNEINRLSIGPALMALHINKSDIQTVQFRKGQVDFVEEVAVAHHHNALLDYGLTAQANYAHISFIKEGDPTQALPIDGNNDRFKLGLNVTAAGALKIVSESIGGIGAA